MSPPLRVFGYGSLMFAPERAEAVTSSVPATLRDEHRAFNKRSYVRGCREADARWPDAPVPRGFAARGWRHSLALGSEPGGEMVGRVLTYEPSQSELALAALDRREGYSAAAGAVANGYDRRLIEVEGESGPLTALAYLGNPRSTLYAPVPLDVAARVLIAATPRPGAQAKRGGLEYFLDTRAVLFEGGIVDPLARGSTRCRESHPWILAGLVGD